MRGMMTEAVMQDGLLPSMDDMEFLPQDDDLYAEVFGHHDMHNEMFDNLDSLDDDGWETDF